MARVVYQNKQLGLEIIESDKPMPMQEAEYQGRKVKLGKVQRGGKKKFQVYVKDPKTKNVKKVSFGDTTGLSIKTKDPARRKSFRARHNCDNPGPRTKARYWSCRMWSGPNAVKNMLKKEMRDMDELNVRDVHGDKKIENPKTGKKIKFSSALKAPKGSPVYNKARKMYKSLKKDK